MEDTEINTLHKEQGYGSGRTAALFKLMSKNKSSGKARARRIAICDNEMDATQIADAMGRSSHSKTYRFFVSKD